METFYQYSKEQACPWVRDPIVYWKKLQPDHHFAQWPESLLFLSWRSAEKNPLSNISIKVNVQQTNLNSIGKSQRRYKHVKCSWRSIIIPNKVPIPAYTVQFPCHKISKNTGIMYFFVASIHTDFTKLINANPLLSSTFRTSSKLSMPL